MLESSPCFNRCGKTFTLAYLAKVHEKYPHLPPMTCQDCASAMLRRIRTRETRRPALSEHDIKGLAAAGCGNASRGVRNLVDAYQLALSPPRLPYAAWLRDDSRGFDYAAEARMTALRIDTPRYDWLRHLTGRHTAIRPGARRGHDAAGALHALVWLFEHDAAFRQATLDRNPPTERYLAAQETL